MTNIIGLPIHYYIERHGYIRMATKKLVREGVAKAYYISCWLAGWFVNVTACHFAEPREDTIDFYYRR